MSALYGSRTPLRETAIRASASSIRLSPSSLHRRFDQSPQDRAQSEISFEHRFVPSVPDQRDKLAGRLQECGYLPLIWPRAINDLSIDTRIEELCQSDRGE